jgi:glucoamylase
MRPVLQSLAAALLATALIIPSGAVAATSAPGAPGAKATWTRADKQGFGTAIGARSKVWFTLSRGELTEPYHPRLDTPSLRDSSSSSPTGAASSSASRRARASASSRLPGAA